MRRMATMLALALGLGVGLGDAAWAQGTPIEGEVRKVDKSAGKVTIRHGPIPQFDMGAMTMVFRVQDPAILERLQAGDRIRFVPEKVGGAFTVMSVEPER